LIPWIPFDGNVAVAAHPRPSSNAAGNAIVTGFDSVSPMTAGRRRFVKHCHSRRWRIVNIGRITIFFMFGKYTTEAMQGISPERTEKAIQLIKANKGKVVSMVAVMGEHDLVFTLDFPDAESAFATSVGLNKLTGISFTTSPVVEVEMFDKLIARVKDL
jgi:uncharacterized protein with GYD domain